MAVASPASSRATARRRFGGCSPPGEVGAAGTDAVLDSTFGTVSARSHTAGDLHTTLAAVSAMPLAPGRRLSCGVSWGGLSDGRPDLRVPRASPEPPQACCGCSLAGRDCRRSMTCGRSKACWHAACCRLAGGVRPSATSSLKEDCRHGSGCRPTEETGCAGPSRARASSGDGGRRWMARGLLGVELPRPCGAAGSGPSGVLRCQPCLPSCIP
mmetsp:Transcript_29619/g.83518  ORF Transcript_29619/g.83518 Transcript_29619/m.83518 type:complete len:213 (-) Transcript_29619:200-838(-)